MSVALVECHAPRSPWDEAEEVSGACFVMPRSGRFLREVQGVEHAIDRSVSYFESPGHEQRIAHPVDGGDTCLAVAFSGSCAASSPDPRDLPAWPVPSSPRMHLASVLLLRAHRRRDECAVEEHAIDLVGAAVSSEAAVPETSLRPGTLAHRARLVSEARLLLQDDVNLRVPALARRLGTSPHHLSRIFRAVTGCTIAGYRNGLRVALVVDRLAQGEADLSALAADAGFYDHAHMSRTVLRATTRTPSSLRTLLTAPDGG